MGKIIGKLLVVLFIAGAFGATVLKTLETVGLGIDKNLQLPVGLVCGGILYFATNHLNKILAMLYRITVSCYGYMLFFNKKTNLDIFERVVIGMTILVCVTLVVKLIQKFNNKKVGLDEVGEFAKNSKVFYASMKWKKARLNILQNTSKSCAVCGNSHTDSWHVDHILPRSIFPCFALSVWNLRRLCPDCNTAKSNQVTSHEIKDLYRNFRTKAELSEFEDAVNRNPNYRRILELANQKTVA